MSCLGSRQLQQRPNSPGTPKTWVNPTQVREQMAHHVEQFSYIPWIHGEALNMYMSRRLAARVAARYLKHLCAVAGIWNWMLEGWKSRIMRLTKNACLLPAWRRWFRWMEPEMQMSRFISLCPHCQCLDLISRVQKRGTLLLLSRLTNLVLRLGLVPKSVSRWLGLRQLQMFGNRAISVKREDMRKAAHPS